MIKEVARGLSREAGDMRLFDIAERLESVMWEEKNVPESGLVLCRFLPKIGRTDRYVHAAVRDFAIHRLGGTRPRATQRRQNHPSERKLHRPEDLAFVEIEER